MPHTRFIYNCRRTWQTVGTVDTLSFTVDSLVEGNEYVFRVSAVNKYGTGEPTELQSPVVARSQFGEYGEIFVNCMVHFVCWYHYFVCLIIHGCEAAIGLTHKKTRNKNDNDHFNMKVRFVCEVDHS